jgi:hypothetical protein
MIHKYLIIGSGFSALGAIYGLNKKRQSFSIITGYMDKNIKSKNLINLESREFTKYKDEIYQSIKNNNLKCNVKNNFISFLGIGGLSKLWGKIINTRINGNYKYIRILKKELNIKQQKKIYIDKNTNFYLVKENQIQISKLIFQLKKKRKIIKDTVNSIKFCNKKKYFVIKTINKKIIKSKKILFACGIFSTINIFFKMEKNSLKKNKIDLFHSDLIYGLFLSRKKFDKKNQELLYFDKKEKKFSGRIAILNNQIINKLNLNIIFKFIYIFFNFFNVKVYIFSILTPRPKKSSFLSVRKNSMHLSYNSVDSKKTVNKIKKILSNSFKGFFFFFKRTLPGSDFHYGTNIIKNIDKKKIKPYYKNIFILDNSVSERSIFFPTFSIIYNAYLRIIENKTLHNLIKKH